MNTIDSTSRFLTQIAEQVSGLVKQFPEIEKKSTLSVGEKRSLNTPRDVNTLVAQRVQAIDIDDPRRRRKAFRIFLESILLNELGEDLVNDPGFHTLVDNVQQTMERNPELLAAIDKAGDFLLEKATTKKK